MGYQQMTYDKTAEEYKVEAAKSEAEYWKFKKIAAEHDAKYSMMRTEIMEERRKAVKILNGV